MKTICPVIDITYLIEQRKIKRSIRKQLINLEVQDMFIEECIVNFKSRVYWICLVQRIRRKSSAR